ncbi:glycoside hydrolase family 10 protein [Prevotella sp. HCN-7019]|uniref:glycoside hydrolase family 10 protein n=1 Tax=Prevotella sp. HCN-7019 TaxID=3134668 RepID=UPI0030C56AD8
MIRRITFLLTILTAALTLAAQPKYEVRAVWLTTIGGIDWPHSYASSNYSIERQKDELRTILDRLQRANINTVLLQTRIRATTIYPSEYEPWDGCLSGKPGKSPGYDALKFAIDECHRRGMELHAWVVAIPVGKWNATGCARLRKRHPGLVKKIGAEGYMDPEKPQTAEYLADLCAEITGNYDVDGIHLDYIRYHETWPMKVSRRQGRANITNIVRAISHRVKSIKPWVKMSCSPIGKYKDLSRFSSYGWNAYERVCQDAQAWLRDGLMDALFPMMYFRGNQFYPFALDWSEQSYGRIVAPGLGIYFMSPGEKDWPLSDITREMLTLRHYGMGHAYFRSKFFTDNVKGIYDFAKETFNRHPALIPPMTWESTTIPATPSALSRKKHSGDVEILSWRPVDKDTTKIMYNVYCSREYPVNTDEACNLMMARLQKTSIIIPRDPSRYYAVTALDRYGNESKPLQEKHVQNTAPATKLPDGLLKCDGKTLRLPEKSNVLDASFITIETLQGHIVATRPYKGSTTDVSRLPEGMYVLRSLGRKGVSHRLGHFIIRRHITTH